MRKVIAVQLLRTKQMLYGYVSDTTETTEIKKTFRDTVERNHPYGPNILR